MGKDYKTIVTPAGEGSLSAQVLDRLTGASKAGPLNSLYNDKYKQTFLQFPANVEAAEENHWVRFDVRELKGDPIKQDESRNIFNTKNRKSTGNSLADRIIEAGAEKATIIATTALMAPVNAIKSTVNTFLNDLPPGVANFGRDLLGMSTSSSGRVRGLGSIMLYAPHTRQNSLRLSWQNQPTGIAGAAMNSAGGNIGATVKSAFKGTNETINSMIKNRGTLGESIMAQIGGAAVGNDTLKDIALKSKGRAFNNHLEMFFQNVDFRTFAFDFKLAPRNAHEARTIQEIVQLFKYAASPGLVEGQFGVFFAYPNVFEIEFYNEAQTHKIATSALTGISVNHAGSGVNSTFYDDYPVETDLSLQFTEIEIVHKSKIDQGYQLCLNSIFNTYPHLNISSTKIAQRSLW